MDSLSSAPLLVAPVYFWQPNFYFLATKCEAKNNELRVAASLDRQLWRRAITLTPSLVCTKRNVTEQINNRKKLNVHEVLEKQPRKKPQAQLHV